MAVARARRAKSTRRFTPAGIGLVVAAWRSPRPSAATRRELAAAVAAPSSTGTSFRSPGRTGRGGRSGSSGRRAAAAAPMRASTSSPPAGRRWSPCAAAGCASAGYDPVLYGNYLLIHGEGERRSYFYAHLRRPAAVDRGDRVFTGERVGVVGETGNARTVGCHLHFEIHVDGAPDRPRARPAPLGPLQLSSGEGPPDEVGLCLRVCRRGHRGSVRRAPASAPRRPRRSRGRPGGGP